VEFFANINDTFVCLIGTAIQHCFKEWRTGTVAEEQVDFKSESAGGKSKPDERGQKQETNRYKATYQRLMNTWKRYNKTVQKLLLANIKSELSALLVGNRERTHRERTEPLEIMDRDDYVDELRWELGQARAKQADMAGDEEDMVWEVGHERAKTCETHRASQAGLSELEVREETRATEGE